MTTFDMHRISDIRYPIEYIGYKKIKKYSGYDTLQYIEKGKEDQSIGV